jgi:hypothetical protein
MRLPNDSQRLTIYGMTGSGKTIAALWHLSQRSFTTRPWVVFDFKGDSTIAEIPHTHDIGIGDVPKHPGIYIVRPIPEMDDEKVEAFMWKIWERERIGVYIDEGYMVARKNSAFKALLTQGRSKSIPMITLSQRPVWMSRFVISEADFHQVFFLADESDRSVVQRFIPYDITENRLPKYHSYYYDIGEDDFTGLKPVPKPEVILETFETRLKKKPRLL